MGQSNFNKAAIKAKENGANDKGKLEQGYKNILIVLGALLVALLIFATLVSFKVINCTNSSTMLAEAPDGSKYYVAAVTNKDGTGYENKFYYITPDGKRVDCIIDEEAQTVCVKDENGENKIVTVDGGEVGKSVDGQTLFSEYSPFTGAFYYYFFNENNERVDCTLSSDYSKLTYTDAEGNEKEFVFAPVSGSDVSGSDVSGSDVSSADAQ